MVEVLGAAVFTGEVFMVAVFTGEAFTAEAFVATIFTIGALLAGEAFATMEFGLAASSAAFIRAITDMGLAI
jgi:hypothetical protein